MRVSTMKHSLRKDMRRRLGQLGPQEAAGKSRQACRALVASAEFERAGAVMLYLPIHQELDVEPIARAAWRSHKTVVVPRPRWRRRELVPVRIRSLTDGLCRGPYGIREPADGEPFEPGEIDLIVVPALAYDRRGNRLGRGGGFYDRFLSREDVRALTCGLAFTEQLVDAAPVHETDRHVDMLATDAGLLRFRVPERIKPESIV